MTTQQAFALAFQHHRAGRLREAEQLYEQILAEQPAHADALHYLGVIAHQLGRNDHALDLIRKSIALNPRHAPTHSNLGIALEAQGRFDDAIAAYREAINIRPQYPEAWCNLGSALKSKGQLDEAVAACQMAIALRPGYAKAYCNLGNAFKDQARLDDAIAAYRQAVTFMPNFPEAHSNLAYTLHFHPSYGPRAIAEENSRWNRQHAESFGGINESHSNDRNPNRRLRVGYISPDFRDHCQSLFTVPLLWSHDPDQVEIRCYSDVACPDALTQQLQGYAKVWTNIIGKSDEEVAALIRHDAIDILVDLTMHMARNRLLLFARKPAPVQVSWLAYPGSTGLTAIHYRLSDPYLDPPGLDPPALDPSGADEAMYSEKTVRLPDTFWCYDPQIGREVLVNILPAASGATITFGCLNNFCKTNDVILDLWAKVLREVPGSRLLLLAREGSHRQRTVDRLTQAGVDPSRIEFATPRPRREYLELYHRIDIGLDSFPYNGHTTSLDSFWMGVPVVTLVGETPVSRAGWCQLSNLRLQELAAQTPEQFVKIAVGLAGDLPRLQALRSTLRQRMEESPLMDAPRFARGIEATYRQMWRTWCQSTPA